MNEEKIYEELFNIVSSNYTENIDENGQGNFTLDDDQRENLLIELTAYVIAKVK